MSQTLIKIIWHVSDWRTNSLHEIWVFSKSQSNDLKMYLLPEILRKKSYGYSEVDLFLICRESFLHLLPITRHHSRPCGKFLILFSESQKMFHQDRWGVYDLLKAELSASHSNQPRELTTSAHRRVKPYHGSVPNLHFRCSVNMKSASCLRSKSSHHFLLSLNIVNFVVAVV